MAMLVSAAAHAPDDGCWHPHLRFETEESEGRTLVLAHCIEVPGFSAAAVGEAQAVNDLGELLTHLIAAKIQDAYRPTPI